MMSEPKTSASRFRSIDRISSPEQLTEYLRVTRPSVWVILTVVILLLGGIIAWSAVGTLQTNTAAYIVVEDHRAEIIVGDNVKLEAGMPLRISGQEYTIAAVEMDPQLGQEIGIAELPLPDDFYNGTVVTERIHPISFLLTSW